MADQAIIDRITAEIVAINALILTVSEQPTLTPAKVISYTMHGRQVTLNSSVTAEVIPALIKARNGLYVEMQRAIAGGIPVSYGVPRW